MTIQNLLRTADTISTIVGKAFAWLIVALMIMVVIEVFKRYALNAPTASNTLTTVRSWPFHLPGLIVPRNE